MNDQPGDIASLVLTYQKTLKKRYSPHKDAKCIPVINAFLEKHSIKTSMRNTPPFKVYVLNLVLSNLCSDWKKTKSLLQSIKKYPIMILVVLANPRVNDFDPLFADALFRFGEIEKDLLKTVRSVTNFPVLLLDWMNLYDFYFSSRILQVFFKQKMIPPISEDAVRKEARRFLLH